MLRLFAPDLTDDPALGASWGRYERHSVPPGTAMAMVPMLGAADVRAVLPAIRVPTLVIARDAGPIATDHGRYLADRIPDAAYVEVHGTSSLIWAGDEEAVSSEIQQFITGARPMTGQDRVLATILFTDIVASTELASSIGDARWRDLLGEHDRIVRTELDRFRGREVKTTGDGFLAVFDGPARAIRCAEAIHKGVGSLDIEVRAGLHTGEVELLDGDLGGVAVHIAARVSARAGAGEVLVSSTVKDLVIGSDIAFEDAGTHTLKGVPGEWHLFAVATT
jgi:class 3 adenylate cyclase